MKMIELFILSVSFWFYYFATDEPVEQDKDVEQDKVKEGQEADQAESKEKLKDKESSNRAVIAKQKERVSALDISSWNWYIDFLLTRYVLSLVFVTLPGFIDLRSGIS